MRDIRKLEKEAEKIIRKNETMKFRLLLKNGDLAERVIKPVKSSSSSSVVYREIRNFYKPKKDKIEDVKNISKNNLKRINSIEMSSSNESGDRIHGLVISLLEMGYELIE